MATNNAEYWAQRMKLLEEALADQGFDYVQNLEKQFDRAIAQIEKETAAWYQRFADNNGITYIQARKWLTADELQEFHWTVEEYIQYAQDNELSGQWIRQLENASAKVHISRLDALKLELQQQVEQLAGGQLDGIDALARRIYTEGYYKTAFEIQRGVGVGWTLHALNEDAIAKVLSRPWTTDGQTFRDRVWTNKTALLNSVNQHLTQMIIRGESARKTIDTLAHDMNVSKSKAGRLVMTESAYFSSAAQKDCFNTLGVERYVVVATLDKDTCDVCGDMDGKVFKMSEYEEGLTAPPFHPWCRCCTAPWYEDMQNLGARAARDGNNQTFYVPRDTTYKSWMAQAVQTAPAAQSGGALNNSQNPATITDIVERATGAKKGTPLDLQTAVQGANPYYTTGGTPYHVNCQRCVPTYEMRRRGYDVIAKPKPVANNTVLWGSEPFADSAGNPVSYTMNQTEAAVKRELKNAPDGARYGIYVAWKGRNRGAHVFVAEKQGGVVRYIDPQPGRLDASGYFALGRPGQFGYLRMDNLDITTDESILQATMEVKQP